MGLPGRRHRELVVNALTHRDYHPMAHGTQVRMMLYPDRFEIANPGGLFGSISPDSLLVESQSVSRNATLAKLLEEVEGIDDHRPICENRGSGLSAMATLLRRAGMDPPEFTGSVRQFVATVANHGLPDEPALAWLASLDTHRLSDRQRPGLGFLRRKGSLTNRQYRMLNGCDALEAAGELGALNPQGRVEKRGDHRGTVWYLAERVDDARTEPRTASPRNRVDKRDRRDRREEMRALLVTEQRSTAELSEALGVGRQAVLRWLRRLEDADEVGRTGKVIDSPKNLWRPRR